jgi:uncharacterized membrane protein YoaT (DUF817 family)
VIPCTRLARFIRELSLFTDLQARACLFPGLFFCILGASRVLPLHGLPRYDFIFLAAIAAQAALYLARIESKDEVRTLCVFHLLGLALEVFKTHPSIGSWSYPEPGFFKVSGVPLYSGFMYAAVAGYMCQAWRLFDLELVRYPSYRWSAPLCAGIYLNFFTHHFVGDARGWLFAAVLSVFWGTTARFTVVRRCAIPVVLSFLLIGFFVWVAENLSTYLGAWAYPDQLQSWAPVSFGKISSWSLLVILSFLLVADLKQMRERRRGRILPPVPDAVPPYGGVQAGGAPTLPS